MNNSNFNFDFGIGSNNPSSRPLNQQKNQNSYSTSSSFSQPKPTPTWQPGRPSWTHQPAPGQTRTELGGPTSMVGDIKGKSWTAATPQTGAGIGIGIVNKNPNLFGDLVSSALGQGKSTSSAPLKSATTVKSSFSMSGVADSLPKSSVNYSANSSVGGGATGGASWGGNLGMNNGSGLGGQSLRTGGGVGVGGGMGASKDPFGSLFDRASKPIGGGGSGIGANVGGKGVGTPKEDVDFGDFQNAPKSNASTFSTSASSVPKMSSFGSQSQAPMQSVGGDSFDIFSGGAGTGGSAVSGGGQQFSGGDDWGVFEGGHDDGGATDHEGLPPPPAGVSASTAKGKGLDNYKQGQFADAIKWLSWAEILLERAGETAGNAEVLTTRASCYKEVGEYKKAVADCTKILDHDGTNVAVLVQRALLYESMEKYRLGAEDLRTVMKLDPGNRVARSTIHRLNKMAD